MTKKKLEVRALPGAVRILPCKLTDAEMLNRAEELAGVIQDMDTEEDRQASLKQELKARLSALQSNRSRLASIVARREETRDVQINREFNLVSLVYREVRADTGEVILERPMTESERQEEMELPT